MPIASTDEQRDLCATLREAVSGAGPAAVRAREGGRGTDELWSAVAGIGVFAVAVPEERGGAGGRIADVAAALERLADDLVPGPVVTTVLAALVLAGEPDSVAAKEILPRLAKGAVPFGVAAGPGGLVAGEDADRAR